MSRTRSPFFALLLVQIRALLMQSNLGSGKRKRGRAVSGLGALLMIAFLSLYLSGLYSFAFASVLAPMGALDLMLLMILTIASGMMFMMTLFSAQGLLFGGRDTDLLFSLPVPPFQILCAKASAVYLECLLMSVLFALPAGVAYLMHGGQGGAGFLALLLLGALFLPLLPTTLSVAVGFLLSAISSRTRHKKLVINIASLVLFGCMFWFLFQANQAMSGSSFDIVGMRATLSRTFPAAALLTRAAYTQQFLPLLLCMLMNLAPFALVLALLAPRYQSIVSRLNAHTLKTDFRLTAVRGGSPMGALLRKEARRYLGSTIYIFNTGFGLLLMLGGSIYLCFARGNLDMLLYEFGVGAQMLFPALTAALCMLVGTVGVTSVSTSLEGKQLWILREAPLSIRQIFGAKIGFNLLLTLPCLALCALLLTFACGFSADRFFMLLLLPALHSLLCACGGLMVNLLFPKLDYVSDTSVVKQSLSAFIGIFAPMLLTIALCALYLLVLASRMSFLTYYWTLCAGYLLAVGGMLLLLRGPGKRLFLALGV